MANVCPECGADLPAGTTCDEIFGSFLEKDYVDPGYGAVHFLTVGVFMIQHGRYSEEALAWIQPHIRDFLDGKATQEQIRRASRRQVDQSQRAWKVSHALVLPDPSSYGLEAPAALAMSLGSRSSRSALRACCMAV